MEIQRRINKMVFNDKVSSDYVEKALKLLQIFFDRNIGGKKICCLKLKLPSSYFADISKG